MNSIENITAAPMITASLVSSSGTSPKPARPSRPSRATVP
jgi:hypothetical protein